MCLALCAGFSLAVQAAEPASTVVISEDDGHPYSGHRETWEELVRQSKERAAAGLALARD